MMKIHVFDAEVTYTLVERERRLLYFVIFFLHEFNKWILMYNE